MARVGLPNEVRAYIVQALACFDTPAVVRDAVKKEFDVDVSPQAVEAYDPTKRAGRNLAPRWKELFRTAREDFLKNTGRIAISHRSVRLRAIQRMAARAEDMKNLQLAAALHEQAAKEVGNFYTNRHELTGKDGGPLKHEHTVSAADDAKRKLTALVVAASGSNLDSEPHDG